MAHGVVNASQTLQNLHNSTTSLDIRQKGGGAVVPLFVGGAGSPCNTVSPEPRSTSIQSGILIHTAVWPQQTWDKNWGTQ